METRGIPYEDAGVFEPEPANYSDISIKVAKEVQSGKYTRAILICGSGIGIAITANKVRNVRATVIHDAYSAERAQASNNAQIACFGPRLLPRLQPRVCLISGWQMNMSPADTLSPSWTL